jgi:hypothetical protein
LLSHSVPKKEEKKSLAVAPDDVPAALPFANMELRMLFFQYNLYLLNMKWIRMNTDGTQIVNSPVLYKENSPRSGGHYSSQKSV